MCWHSLSGTEGAQVVNESRRSTMCCNGPNDGRASGPQPLDLNCLIQRIRV